MRRLSTLSHGWLLFLVVQSACGQTPTQIEAAKKELEQGRKTVNEVMYDVGYTDTKAFRDVFKKVAGLSPIDYRKKYNKEM